MTTVDAPKLDCPSCGVGLIPAHGCGRYDENGNFLEHRNGCQCPWCEWMWSDDADPVTCGCGAVVGVRIEDETACAVEVQP